MIRVALAEDNYLVREGVLRLLEEEDDIEVVAVCEDLPTLERAIAEQSPDLVLTDIRMPPDNSDEGIQVANRLRGTSPETGVVALSQFAEPEYALALLAEGAERRGYLLEDRVSEAERFPRRSEQSPAAAPSSTRRWSRPWSAPARRRARRSTSSLHANAARSSRWRRGRRTPPLRPHS